MDTDIDIDTDMDMDTDTDKAEERSFQGDEELLSDAYDSGEDTHSNNSY